MGHMTSDETSKVFTELGISGPSSSSCDRLPKLLSAVWESHRAPWEGTLRQQEVVAAEAVVVAVSLDGVMVPDKDAQRSAKATREAAKKQGLAKQCSGPAGYREVGCGTVTLFDADAKPLDTVHYGRAPEYKKQTLTAQLDAELASLRAVRPDLAVVALADGAEENWRYFERPVYDKATKIVDHGHASQHLLGPEGEPLHRPAVLIHRMHLRPAEGQRRIEQQGLGKPGVVDDHTGKRWRLGGR